jgi:hypothetical protein
VNVTQAGRDRLEAIIADRSAPQKHGWRAKIILATADGCGTAEIMCRLGKSKPVVWRWQAQFMSEGVTLGRPCVADDVAQSRGRHLRHDWPLGNAPATRVRQRISLMIRSSGLLVRIFCQWMSGKA